MPTALLLAAASAVMLGSSPHAGPNRPVCRVLSLGLLIAFVGEIDDFVTDILGRSIGQKIAEPDVLQRIDIEHKALMRRIIRNHAAQIRHIGKSDGKPVRNDNRRRGFARGP